MQFCGHTRHTGAVSANDPPGGKPAAPTPDQGAAGESGSIDVAMSGPMPEAGASGAIDVKFTDPEGKPAVKRRRAATIPAVVGAVSARVVHAADKIGDKVVQASDSLTKVGESLSALPVVPRTRRGRVMARSVVLSFLLVFSWIAVIVGLQLRRPRPPDFRPNAEAVLIALRDGRAAEVYKNASVRFKEVVLESTFVEQMEDMNRTLGAYREISAVLDTEVNRGPGGRTARIDVRIEYETGPTKGAVSFRHERGEWKMLGISIDVPAAIAATAGTEAQRKARVRANVDEMRAVAESILVRWGRGEVAEIWREASVSFQQGIDLEGFQTVEDNHRKLLGPYRRILDVTAATQNPGRTSASLTLLIEFEKATITGTMNFTRVDDTWRLTFFNLVMPLPRVPE